MRTRTKVDGGGGARCGICNGHLDHSWVVLFDTGDVEHRCSTHLGEQFDNHTGKEC